MRTSRSRNIILALCFMGALFLGVLVAPQHFTPSNSTAQMIQAQISPATPPAIAAEAALDPAPQSAAPQPAVPQPAAAQPAATQPAATQPATTQQSANPQAATKQAATTYRAIDEQYRDRFGIASNEVLAPSSLPNTALRFNERDLLTVLQNTQAYFQAYSTENPDIQRTGILGTQGVTVANVLDTLSFMISTLQEDISNGRPIRLKDPVFVNANFRVIRWSAYNPEDPQETLVRLTKYAVFTHPGSRTRTATYNVPLYQLREDAEGDRFYLNITKQQVLSGIYESGGSLQGRVDPLVYLTRESFEDAIMQGTILIKYADGTSAYFNVDRNNGIVYVPGIDPYQQRRYWYFRPVDNIQGYGHQFEKKIAIKPGVTFAGDVLNIGLGRMVVLEHSTTGQRELKLGVIADTGGAFLPNLHQLDYLAGVFGDRNEFYNAIRSLPEYSKAYFLVRKSN
ncbi:MAG: hypothetical protein MUF49_16820 [Oculatellaceae cyanobacterium Prado106]|nr:hypothetical protein [Oculatellaceae cyanobacterium Prado106]